MFASLPKTVQEIMDWEWSQFDPYFQNLAARELTAATVGDWLADWSTISRLLDELGSRLYVATTVNTTDEQAEKRFFFYLENIDPKLKQANHTLNQKLLASGLQPEGFEIALRNIRAKAELFREANLPLLTQESKLNNEYDKIIGAQTVTWEGKEVTLKWLETVLRDPDRAKRERAWRLEMERRLQDRDALNDLWARLMAVREQIAANADVADYRAYKWRDMLRFDYTPEDCETFHKAIETVVVPAVRRLYQKRQQRLGLDRLRPWDVDVDTSGKPALHPFDDTTILENKTEAIFTRVDPELGKRFRIMRDEALLDLDNRKGKAPGGYSIPFAYTQRPFIFMNAVGLHDDVQTLLHEGGHSFHAFEVFESAHLSYFQQQEPPMEFAEVASMSMELLGAPYLTADQGGFYSPAEAARARIEHLESGIRFWPYMAVVDAFQHWVYTHHTAASNPANCDAKWAELWDRFMQGIDFGGLNAEKETGWQRKLHIFQVPFYYVEYGLAQLGAVQVWANSLRDRALAVQNYRKALSLGGSAALPKLFEAAGAKFAFDSGTMAKAVDLIEHTLGELEQAL